MDLKTKANIVIAIALTALAAISWLSFRENRHLNEADGWVSHTRDVLETSESLRSHLSDAAIARRLLLQGDLKQIDTFHASESASLTDFETLRRLTSDNPVQQKRLGQLEPIVKARLALLEKSIAIHEQIAHDESSQSNLTDQLTLTVRQFVEREHEFDDVEEEFLRRRSAAVNEGLRRASIADAVLSLSVFLFILGATFALNRELSHRRRAEEALADQKSLLQSILDTCSDSIVVADSSAKIIMRNPAATRLHPNVPGRVTEDVPRALGYYKPDEVTLFRHEELPLWRALRGDHVDNLEMCIRPPGQQTSRWALASGSPLLAKNTKAKGGVVFYRDISERKQLESKLAKYATDLELSNLELQEARSALERLALADDLTGLHNRRGFLSLAEQSLKLARRSKKPFALVFVDLDGLKKINDTLGHNEGNRAITDVAVILMDSFRHCDVLCRLGGDEFAVLMIDAGEETTRIVRKRLMDKVEKLNVTGQRPYRLSFSIGILICDSDQGLPLEALLERADALMYKEKQSKGTARCNDPRLTVERARGCPLSL
jgi:diguanylate cyclase (GGDEF)-like protein